MDFNALCKGSLKNTYNTIDKEHRCFIYSFFYKGLEHPVRVLLIYFSHVLESARHITNLYERSFLPAATRLWKELPSLILESQKLQRFRKG